jgi:23S rRNA pseudouridine2605 synthase
VELDEGDIQRLSAAAGLPVPDAAPDRARRAPVHRSGAPGKGPQGGRNFGNPAGSRGEAPAVRRVSMFAPAPGPSAGRGAGGASAQPDPLKTSQGYIGQDALQRKRAQDAERGGPPKRKRKPGGR